MKNIIYIFAFVFFGIISCKQAANSQDKGKNRGGFMDRKQDEALQEPFKGVFTAQGKQDGLFPIKATGVSIKPIVVSAKAFVNSLSEAQKEKTLFDVQDDEWRKWSNVDNGIFTRQGISIKEMTQAQRKLAFTMMGEALSAKGLQLSKDIMKTDQTLRELNNGREVFDEDLYFFTIMGTPSMTKPWGWQIDGHHLVINYFVLGDQVVMTPTFMGGEPIITTTGKYKGNTLFQDEQNLGLKFMQSLSSEKQKEATLSTQKGRSYNKTEAFKDNVIVNFEGIKASKLSEEEKNSLLNLANKYISNMKEGHAKVKMEDIKEHINDTYFAWIGKTDDDAVFYYRIHSHVVLIEFDHQDPVGVRGNGRGATRNHIHTVVRTPNGNDYGKDLLRQHLEEHKH